MSSSPARIYLVDDDPQLRDGLAHWLAQAGYQAQGFDSGSAFLRAHSQLQAGCIIVDMVMPGMTGLDLHQRLVAAGCRWPVIVLTGHANRPDVARAMDAGIVAFLEKPVREVELLAAVMKGQAHLLGRIEMIPDPDLAQRVARLTLRERQVLGLVLEKKLNKQIAGTLGIAETTVKGYRRAVMRKLGAKKATELVVLAIRAGLYSAPRS